MKRTEHPQLRDSFVDLLLEERFAERRSAAPSTRPPQQLATPVARQRGRSLALAATLLVAGVAVVVGVAGARGENDPAATRTTPAQDPIQTPNTMDARAFFPLGLGDRWVYREQIGVGDSARERRISIEVTAVVTMDDRSVAMLTELGGESGIVFSYWAADERGIHRIPHANDVSDPTLELVPGLDGLQLPSPLGARARWTTQRVQPRQLAPVTRAGQARPPSASDAVTFDAQLLGVNDSITCGDREWSAVCVQFRNDGQGHTEELCLARGAGIVRQTIQRVGEPERIRELVSFTPANPQPDRETVLSSLVGTDAAAAATWLEAPADSDAAWTQRSSFAVLVDPDQDETTTRVIRVFGAHATPFDPTSVDAYAAMAADEDFAPRMQGFFAQRMTMGLVWLHCRLHAATTDEDVADGLGSGITLGAGSTKGYQNVVVTTVDGEIERRRVEVETRACVPIRVEMK